MTTIGLRGKWGRKWFAPVCPKCGSAKLHHVMYSRWHDCKECRYRFQSDCSPHKHGGSLT